LDYALPLADLEVPACFETFHRRLIAGQEKQGDGTREFIRVLRLLEDYPMEKIRKAV